MKKLIVIAIAIFSFTSCQFTEEITLNENGTGNYNLKIDMGQMMSQKKSKDQDTEKKEKKEKVDSIINFSELFKKLKKEDTNLSKEDLRLMKRMENLKLHMLVDEEKGEMKMDFSFPFKSLNDLKTIGDDIKRLDEIQKKKEDKKGEDPMNEIFTGISKSGKDVDYTYNGKKFTRKTILSKQAKKKAKEKEDTTSNNDLGIMKMFSYKLIYHFPKKIKSISYKEAMLGTDGKTLIIEVPMDRLEKEPSLLDFDVKF